MNHKKRLEPMLFDYSTTNRTDFRDGEIKPPIRTEYKEKPICLRIRGPPTKYVHTLSNWIDYVPVGLFTKPKEIVRTNPKIPQPSFSKPVDVQRERIQKKRPRLVMTPAASLDDIEDTNQRQLLMEDMYTTSITKAMQEGLSGKVSRKNIVSPLGEHPAPANPITLPKYQPPYVSPEWRMESVTFDGRQIRTHCDPTKEFWLRRIPPGH